MKFFIAIFCILVAIFCSAQAEKEKRGLHFHLGVGGYSSPAVVHHHVVPSYTRHVYSAPEVHHHHVHYAPAVHHIHHDHHDYY